MAVVVPRFGHGMVENPREEHEMQPVGGFFDFPPDGGRSGGVMDIPKAT